MAMVRKQVYLEKSQDETLKRLAGQLGVPEAEIIRRALDLLSETLSEYNVVEAAARRIGEAATIAYGAEMEDKETKRTVSRQNRWLDDQAWQEELAFMEERARRLAQGGSTVKWRREDSYDEKRFRLPG